MKSLSNLKRKDWPLLSLIALLTLSFAAVFPVYAVTEPKVFVDPPSIITETAQNPAGSTIQVNVTIANMTGLAGFEFKMRWNSSLLTGVSMEDFLFSDVPPGEESNVWKIKHLVGPGEVWYSYTFFDLDQAVAGGYAPKDINVTTNPPDGKQTVAVITLRVEKEPTKTEGFLETDLEIYVSKPGDIAAQPIPHVVEDGYFKLVWSSPETKPYLSVEPDEYIATYLNETFDINVTITTLAAGWELVGLEFRLRYNTTLLEVVEVKNGTFFEPFGDPPNGGVFYFKVVEADYVNVALTVLPDENGTWHPPFPSGSGVVATITFKAIYQGMFPEVAGCDLDLYAIKGGDTAAEPIPFNPEQDGYYQSAIGDDIPPSIEPPSREPAGDISPDQEVKVAVNVTDAHSGVKNVTLSYTTNNDISWNNVTMIYNSSTSLYDGTIPGQPADTTVKYKIIAYDKCDNIAVEDNAGEYYVYIVIPEFNTWLSLFITMFLITTLVILIKRRWKPHRPSIATKYMEP